MHELQIISTTVPVAWCVSQSVMCLHPVKTAEQIEVLFWLETFGGPRNIVLDGGPNPPTVSGSVPQEGGVFPVYHI